MKLYFAWRASPLGRLKLAATERALAGLWLDGQRHFGGMLRDEMTEKPELPVLREAGKWLDDYFAGKKPAPAALALAPCGGEFQLEVWSLLCEIPYGQITTYGSLARALAKKRRLPAVSSRAVGGAVARNPLAIIIPCHRVVGANGYLTGYAGGLEAKAALLRLEGIAVSGFTVPKAMIVEFGCQHLSAQESSLFRGHR